MSTEIGKTRDKAHKLTHIETDKRTLRHRGAERDNGTQKTHKVKNIGKQGLANRRSNTLAEKENNAHLHTKSENQASKQTLRPKGTERQKYTKTPTVRHGGTLKQAKRR